MKNPPAAKASVALLLATLALSIAPTLAARDRELGEVPAGSGSEVWITLGQDVFDQIRREPAALGPGLATLQSHGADHGVVMTRVELGSLEALSSFLHTKVNRCPGFMVHESRDEAARALAAAGDFVFGIPLPVELGIHQQATVKQLLPMVAEANVLATISHLSTGYVNRYYQNPTGETSALWIRDLWAGYAGARLGVDVTAELYDHPTFLQPSVILTITGTTRPEQIVVLGGHLDSIRSGGTSPSTSAPGADDNASGIASLSEALRVLMSSGHKPERTIKFMGYAAEEVGLRGSQAIAAAHANAGEQVIAVLQLDMTAFHGSTEDIALIDDFTSAPLNDFVGDLLDTYQPEILWTTSTCGYACSDHASWHQQGYPAAIPHEAKMSQNNNAIHSASDNLATLGNSAAHAVKFARLALTFAIEAGSGGDLFADGFESGDTTAWSSAFP
jgi:leucyl aminopeptidase